MARVPEAKVVLSTASVYPESTASAFEIAARLGYDGVEVMVWTDPVSQDLEALRQLSDYHGVPILAIHAPCLLITQRVWGNDPWAKLVRSQHVAEELGPHGGRPPAVSLAARLRPEFVAGVERMAEETDVRFAVEDMFPLRFREQRVGVYVPESSPVDQDYRHVTLDLSHTSVSQSDALAMARALDDRLTHVHLADGLGSPRDEHLVPGRGNQPCAELLERLAERAYKGLIVIEVNTRRAQSRADREADLAEALAFTRFNLAAPDGGAEAAPLRSLRRPGGTADALAWARSPTACGSTSRTVTSGTSS